MLTSVLVYFFQENTLFKGASLGSLFCTYLFKTLQCITACYRSCMDYFQQISQFFNILILMVFCQFFIQLGINHTKIVFWRKDLR